MSTENSFHDNNSIDSNVPIATTNDDCLIPSLRFPQKLWRIVNECKSDAISWGSTGLTIIINYNTFREEYLEGENSIFKTTNMASFIRQLNLYGFRKITTNNRDYFGSEPHDQPDIHEFLHEHFKFGRLDLLSLVCRKTGVKKGLLLVKQEGKQIVSRNSQYQAAGMTRLQMCQIALTKALEQATKQYHKEKLKLQLANRCVPCKKIKMEKVEPNNIEIIFQDVSEIQDNNNYELIDPTNVQNGIYSLSEDKIHWEEIFTIPVENTVAISLPY